MLIFLSIFIQIRTYFSWISGRIISFFSTHQYGHKTSCSKVIGLNPFFHLFKIMKKLHLDTNISDMNKVALSMKLDSIRIRKYWMKPLKNWKTNPMCVERSPDSFPSAIWFVLIPFINSEPPLGRVRVPIMWSKVVFPLPDAPMMPTNSPFLTEIEILDKALTGGVPG